MPNIWTHNIYGNCLLEKLELTGLLDRDKGKQLFQLGCQGPDFLFYHRFWPWQKKSVMNELGSRMHKEHCGPVIGHMAEYLLTANKTLQDPETLYLLGFISHHLLDRNLHPYIFLKSGFRKWNHQRFEVMLDTVMVKKLLHKETWRIPVWREIYIGEGFPNGILEMLNNMRQRFFPEYGESPDAARWNEAYRDMVKAQKIFHDPYKIKTILTLRQIDPLVYKRKLPPVDLMNEAKAPWHDPTSKNMVSDKSVWELWDLALADGMAVLTPVVELFKDKHASADRLAQFALTLDNISYETGKPLDSGSEILYEDPII
ncbi:MAG TPA: zinc dependent phospholipase C family protein [Bacilli bacterium]